VHQLGNSFDHLLANPWAVIVLRITVALLASMVAWWIAGRLKRVIDWVFDRIEDALHLRSQGSSLGRLTGAAGPLSTLLDTIAALLRFVVWAFLLYAWLLLIAYLLDASHRSVDLILDPVKRTLLAAGRELVAFLPDLVILILIIAFGRVLHSLVITIGRGIALGRIRAFGLDPSVATPTRRLLTFGLWVSMIVLAAPYLPGAGSKAFQAISVLLGLLVSLGSSSLISNLIGGLSLTYAHAFRVGDRVKIGEHLGDIVALGAITTRLRTIKDEEIVLPNGLVSSASIINYSKYAGASGVQAHAEVTIGYETASERVERALIVAALDTPGVQSDPRPYVLQTELHDYYIRYEICAYTKRPTELHLIETSLRRKMQQHLFADGIEICSPAFFALRDGNAVQLPSAAQQVLAGSERQDLRQEHAIAANRSFVVKVGTRTE